MTIDDQLCSERLNTEVPATESDLQLIDHPERHRLLTGTRVVPWCSVGQDLVLPRTDTIPGGHTQRAASGGLHRREDCNQRIPTRQTVQRFSRNQRTSLCRIGINNVANTADCA